METTTQAQAKNEKVEELKKVIKEIENIKNGIREMQTDIMGKEIYTVELIYKDEKYYLIVEDENENEIFKKEISEDDYYSINANKIYNILADKIEEMLYELKKNGIIEDYETEILDGEEVNYGMHTIGYVDYYMYIYLDKETLEEIEKDNELKDYVEYDERVDQKYLLLTINDLVDFEIIESYYSTNNVLHHVRHEIYYITKEEAKNIIKAFSK